MRVRRGQESDVARALEIWRLAVDATHGFLTPDDRREIDVMVAQEFLPTAKFCVAVDAAEFVVGFLVMDGKMIDALFVHPAFHGRGFGSMLLDHALRIEPDAIVDAREQAANARQFYEARGFRVVGRSQTDPQGRPYPLLHMARRKPEIG